MVEPRVRRTGGRRIGGDGETIVFCADEQTDVEVDIAKWHQLAQEVLHSEGVRGSAELTLMFVPESTIAELNLQYMGKVGPTDVLAFPLDAVEAVNTPGPGAISRGPDHNSVDLGDLPLLLGDVVICPSVAQRQAPSHAGCLDDEFALLIVHGILHVLGLDHDTEVATKKMQSRERELLEHHHWHSEMPSSFTAFEES